ncbi:MAG TPA: FAD-binding protein [Casimicrobiaceae bacterium]|nr:FAD-binding protein [Casimicrobiaceae bacterium]
MILARRRQLLKGLTAVSLFASSGSSLIALSGCATSPPKKAFPRVRPTDSSWPPPSQWQELDRAVGGRLIKVSSPLAACDGPSPDAGCAALFHSLKNPYYLSDQVGLTQTTGWIDAWACAPSVYAVAAARTQDVVAAVNFARQHRLRLVVKGGGHSYQGTSNCADSLLIWTHAMDDVTLHEAFVARGCSERQPLQPAVTIGPGALWMRVYDEVTTRGGRYVQGGGCATVGAAGLIQSGGFGSFSKNYGMAAAALLEAEVVTADGAVRIANPCTNPELFWGLKGGGGGSLGVVTRVTVRTRDLPAFFGGAFAAIKASSDPAFRKLIGRFLAFYRDSLFNRRWGESVTFSPRNAMRIAMVFQGMNRNEAAEVWKPFLDWVAASPRDFTLASPPTIVDVPARQLWNPGYLKRLPGLVIADDRPGVPEGNVFWASNREEAGQFLHGYESLWLAASLLGHGEPDRLADALFAGSRHWPISLHFNKGLAGAPSEEVAAARDTAMNPAVLDAFALAISAAEGPPAFPGVPGHEPDVVSARAESAAIGRAMAELRRVGGSGSYVSESNYFEADWQQSFWGKNYPRLRAVKDRYDPEGLFFVHHGVGSEDWSPDGFSRLA